ncbi:MAG: hypothetical protein WCG04_01760 [Alphaproteobacteria bacterium]
MNILLRIRRCALFIAAMVLIAPGYSAQVAAPDDAAHVFRPYVIGNIGAAIQQALELKAKGENVLLLLDLCGTVTYAREGDPHLRDIDPVTGEKIGSAKWGKPDWEAYYDNAPEAIRYYEGLLTGDLVNRYLRDDGLSELLEKVKGAGVTVLAMTGRSPLTDEDVGQLCENPNWLKDCEKAKKPTDAYAYFKKTAKAAIKAPDDILKYAEKRSEIFEELSGVKFSGQQGFEGVCALSEEVLYSNGIIYSSFNKRKAIVCLAEWLFKNGKAAGPLNFVFVDDDIRTINDFLSKDPEGKDYEGLGLTIELMHYPWTGMLGYPGAIDLR